MEAKVVHQVKKLGNHCFKVVVLKLRVAMPWVVVLIFQQRHRESGFAMRQSRKSKILNKKTENAYNYESE